MNWLRKWWGDDTPKSYYDYPYRPPHWSAKPFRAIAREGRKGRDLPWFQRPVGIIILTVSCGVIVTGIAKKLGLV